MIDLNRIEEKRQEIEDNIENRFNGKIGYEDVKKVLEGSITSITTEDLIKNASAIFIAENTPESVLKDILEDIDELFDFKTLFAPSGV